MVSMWMGSLKGTRPSWGLWSAFLSLLQTGHLIVQTRHPRGNGDIPRSRRSGTQDQPCCASRSAGPW